MTEVQAPGRQARPVDSALETNLGRGISSGPGTLHAGIFLEKSWNSYHPARQTRLGIIDTLHLHAREVAAGPVEVGSGGAHPASTRVARWHSPQDCVPSTNSPVSNTAFTALSEKEGMKVRGPRLRLGF